MEAIVRKCQADVFANRVRLIISNNDNGLDPQIEHRAYMPVNDGPSANTQQWDVFLETGGGVPPRRTGKEDGNGWGDFGFVVCHFKIRDQVHPAFCEAWLR